MLKYTTLMWIMILSACTRQDKVTEYEINAWIDQWHEMAAKADTSYFEYFHDDAVFIGTDPDEVWSMPSFKSFAMPYFVKNKAWDFKPIQRNVYGIGTDMIWFDELLDTWMGKCRASGVIDCSNSKWKIIHYQLSMAVPNEVTRQVIRSIEAQKLINDSSRIRSENPVIKQLEAYNSRDMKEFISTFHPEAELYNFNDRQIKAKGIQEVKDIYQGLFDSSPKLKSTLLNRMVMGNKVIDHEYITGRNGNDEALELIMIYELDSGLIRKAWSIR